MDKLPMPEDARIYGRRPLYTMKLRRQDGAVIVVDCARTVVVCENENCG